MHRNKIGKRGMGSIDQTAHKTQKNINIKFLQSVDPETDVKKTYTFDHKF